MRIISGNLKGKKINPPKDKLTRPLKDMVKESIFNILEHSNEINHKMENSIVLDLFSGSGSFGLECISRGAKYVFFNENYNEAIRVLEKNIHQGGLRSFSASASVVVQLQVYGKVEVRW